MSGGWLVFYVILFLIVITIIFIEKNYVMVYKHILPIEKALYL